MNERILLIEDEEALCMTLSDRLQSEGYVVDYIHDGVSGYERAIRDPADLIILDVMLPGKSGFDVCRSVRQAGIVVPILLLTARTQTEEKVLGLGIGADDYVTKPFQMAELLARIQALLRRAPIRPPADSVIQLGSIRIDLRGTEVWRDGKVVQLSAREFQLLRYLAEHRGTTLSRAEILEQVWGFNAHIFTRTVDVHVSSLRQKLERDPKQPELILTVARIGYKLAA